MRDTGCVRSVARNILYAAEWSTCVWPDTVRAYVESREAVVDLRETSPKRYFLHDDRQCPCNPDIRCASSEEHERGKGRFHTNESEGGKRRTHQS